MMVEQAVSEQGFRRKPITIYEDDGMPSQKVINSAKSNNFRRCMSVPQCLMDVESIMKWKTVDESLHSTYGSESSPNSSRSLQFDKVIIREYGRTVGDNPSCSSGPPVSITWEYNEVGQLALDEYETTRPPRRSHFEMVLPRKVRQDLLRREWDVAQKDIAEAVRRNVKIKNQRKATVNNLNKATKMEEAMESASRKLRRLVLMKKPVHKQVEELEKNLEVAQRENKKLLVHLKMQDYDDVPTEAPDSDDVPEPAEG